MPYIPFEKAKSSSRVSQRLPFLHGSRLWFCLIREAEQPVLSSYNRSLWIEPESKIWWLLLPWRRSLSTVCLLIPRDLLKSLYMIIIKIETRWSPLQVKHSKKLSGSDMRCSIGGNITVLRIDKEREQLQPDMKCGKLKDSVDEFQKMRWTFFWASGADGCTAQNRPHWLQIFWEGTNQDRLSDGAEAWWSQSGC